MRCRPGHVLKIAGAQGTATATASAIIFLGGGEALVLTAGHACEGRKDEKVEFENNATHDLGSVFKFKKQPGYDAGVIKTQATLVDPSPVHLSDPLTTYPYDELDKLHGLTATTCLGRSDRRLSGTILIKKVGGMSVVDFEFDSTQSPGTNGDSGSPLIITQNGQHLLVGIFVRLPQGSKRMRFYHPARALEKMGLPLP